MRSTIVRALMMSSNPFFRNLRRFLREEIHVSRQYEIARVHTETFGKYRHCHMGQDVVVMGTGATLGKYKPIKDAVHIGVNTAYKVDFPLDYLFVCDFDPLYRTDDFYEGIVNTECKKFFAYWLIHTYSYRGIQKHCSETFALKCNAERYFAGENYDLIPVDLRYNPLSSYASVIFHALQFAIWTCPRKIYLVGCDCSDTGHFDGDKTTDRVIARHAKSIYYKGYEDFKHFAKHYYPDTEIVSINPVGLKGLFADSKQ